MSASLTTSSASSATLLEPRPGERRRKLTSWAFAGLAALSTFLVLIPLASVLTYVLRQGLSGLSWDFFVSLPKPAGDPGGGMANAIVGSLVVVGGACAMGLPAGILAGVYLAEVGRGRFAKVVRFLADVLTGLPSIAIGVFVYALVVITMRRFSAVAGSIALAVVMFPTMTRTTEELLRLVPPHLREAALGLGVPAWRATLFIVVRTAAPGIATSAMLSIARVMGETAPLLFTAFNNRLWSLTLDRPMATLPVQIFTYATSPYADWQAQAWAGALVLVGLVLTLNLAARALSHRLGPR